MTLESAVNKMVKKYKRVAIKNFHSAYPEAAHMLDIGKSIVLDEQQILDWDEFVYFNTAMVVHELDSTLDVELILSRNESSINIKCEALKEQELVQRVLSLL